MTDSAADRRSAFFALHARPGVFVMPNPWDVGSARMLAHAGFEALATTSAGFAWSQGRNDYGITRDSLLAHVADLAGAVDVPLNVDSERCFSEDLDGVGETVRLLHDAGAAGCSIEDWNGATGRIDPVGLATERVAAAAEAAHRARRPAAAHRSLRELPPRRARPRRRDRQAGRVPRRRCRLRVCTGHQHHRADRRRGRRGGHPGERPRLAERPVGPPDRCGGRPPRVDRQLTREHRVRRARWSAPGSSSPRARATISPSASSRRIAPPSAESGHQGHPVPDTG